MANGLDQGDRSPVHITVTPPELALPREYQGDISGFTAADLELYLRSILPARDLPGVPSPWRPGGVASFRTPLQQTTGVPSVAPGTTPADVGRGIARGIAPDITSIALGEPAPPLANVPEYGKVPSAEDPRLAGAATEAAGFLPTPAGLTGFGSKLAMAAVPMATRLAPEAFAAGRALLRPISHSPFGWTGTAPIPMVETMASDFHGLISAAKAAHPHGAAVTVYKPEEYAGMRVFASPEGSAGFALGGDDGKDIVSVFKHPDSPHANAAPSMLANAVANGGNRLDVFDTAVTKGYGRSQFRAVARIPWDETQKPEGWDYNAFKQYNNGRPDVVFMVHDPYHYGYTAGDGKMVGSYDEAVKLQKEEAAKVQARKDAGVAAFKELSRNIPGLKGHGQFLTAPELDLVTKRNAANLTSALTTLPNPEEMAAIAFSARAKRGWYRRSAQAITDIFGVTDAPRFTALLAATSPQTGVEDNAITALKIWTNWKAAGSPTDPAAIKKIMGYSVQGKKGEESILDAWINNSTAALSAKDPRTLQISGPKVNSFMLNLRDAVHEVTNDAWMANYSALNKDIFAATRYAKRESGMVAIKHPEYLAMNANARRAAKILSDKTGDVWTPEEIQETIWSWSKTLAEKAYGKSLTRARPGFSGPTAQDLIKAGNLSHEEIASTPDFALLFAQDVYRRVLEAGGYGKELETAAARAAGPRRGAAILGTPTSAEGTPFAQRALSRHLETAAERLDTVANRLIAARAAAIAAKRAAAGPK
jgi:hypothetical protein